MKDLTVEIGRTELHGKMKKSHGQLTVGQNGKHYKNRSKSAGAEQIHSGIKGKVEYQHETM